MQPLSIFACVSEPELGPGFMEWIILLGNTGLERVSLQNSTSFLSLIKLTPLLCSLLSWVPNTSLLCFSKAQWWGLWWSLISQREAKPMLYKVQCRLFCTLLSWSRVSYCSLLLLWDSASFLQISFTCPVRSQGLGFGESIIWTVWKPDIGKDLHEVSDEGCQHRG